MQRIVCAIAAFVLLIGRGSARAADDVVIGALYPMTGPNAQVGADAKAAMDTAVDIINGSHNVPMLLGKGGGLANLGGAHVKLIFADHQGDPQKARAEAERLITQEHVVALIGSYQSATAATISQVAERYQVPYLSADNSSPSLNQRGLKWFFRTSPHDVMFTQAMFDFFRDIGEKTGRAVKTVALFHEDTHLRHRQRQRAEADGGGGGHQGGRRYPLPRQFAVAVGRGAADQGGECRCDHAVFVCVGRDPAGARHARCRLRAEGDHGAVGGLRRAGIPRCGRTAGRGRDEPLGVRAGRDEGAAGDPDGKRDVPRRAATRT